MSRKLELTGQRFGKWTVLMEDGRTGAGSILWLCLCDCGAKGRVAGALLKSGKSTSCGKWCSTTPARRHVDADGYVWIPVKGHPRARTKDGRMREHVVVMERALGRYLLPGENVHHKNGVRSDNRPENLELWVSLQPSGQRPQDLLEWAHEIIERYETK